MALVTIRRILMLLSFSWGCVPAPRFAATVTRVVGFTTATGGFPLAPVLQASDGNLYGTTSTGGNDGAGCVHPCDGTVFKLTPQGQLTVLHTFAYDTATGVYANGATPEGGLVEGADGWLYGTTIGGGSGPSYGIVYKISKTGQFVKLHDRSTWSFPGVLPIESRAQALASVFFPD